MTEGICRHMPAPGPLGPAEEDRLRQAVADLAEPDAALRRLAVHYLGRQADGRTLPHLIGAAADPDREVRQAALEALSSFGPQAREALRLALDDPQPSVRLAALRGLYRTLGEAAGDIFLEQARSESALLRRRSLLYLGLTGGEEAEQAVVCGLRDPASEVRRTAVFALAALCGARASEHLVAALDDGDPGVRRQAIRALEGLFGRSAERQGPQAEMRWKCWWQTRPLEGTEAS